MTTRTIELPVALPEAEDCARCAERLRETLGRVKGIAGVDLDLATRRLTVTYDPAILSLSSLEDRVRETGVTVARRYRHTTLRLEGLHCPDCAGAVEHALAMSEDGRALELRSPSAGFRVAGMVIRWRSRCRAPRAVIRKTT
jgi:copper chaperone CopZ